jgi:hypothetical protein
MLIGHGSGLETFAQNLLLGHVGVAFIERRLSLLILFIIFFGVNSLGYFEDHFQYMSYFDIYKILHIHDRLFWILLSRLPNTYHNIQTSIVIQNEQYCRTIMSEEVNLVFHCQAVFYMIF